MKTQSNAVLYVFLGETALAREPFEQILAEYGMAGAAFITVESPPQAAWIKAEINRVQQVFIRQPYTTAGTVRVNYILGGDPSYLPSLRETVEKYISMLYPTEVYTDIYWWVDDASALDARTAYRKAAMRLFIDSDLQNTRKARVYLLSNLDSHNVFTPQADILRTVALLSLFKDYRPGVYPVAPDASLYNDFLFGENGENAAPKKGPKFFTAGCRSIQVPKKAIKGFLLGLLLGWKKFAPIGIASIAKIAHMTYVPFTKWAGSRYVYGLALPKAGDYTGLSRKAVISRLFGHRLEEVLSIYAAESVQLPAIEEWKEALRGLPLYQALEWLDEGGEGRQMLRQAVEENRQALHAAESGLKKWLNAGFAKPDKKKRRISFWVKQAEWPYQLAAAYLEQLFHINALEAFDRHLHETLAFIEAYCQTLRGYLQKVEKAQETFREEAALLEASLGPFPKAVDYFATLFDEYASIQAKALQNLCGPMLYHLRGDTFADYLSRLENFVENTLLPAIDRPFTDLLAYIEGHCQWPALLAEWAMRGSRYGVKLKTGYVGLYAEANVFLPCLPHAAKLKAAYEAYGLGRMNLFADDQAERIDILYQAGVFGLEDLYYKDLYL